MSSTTVFKMAHKEGMRNLWYSSYWYFCTNESITDSKNTNNGRWIVLSSSTRPHSLTVQPICHICVSKLTIIGSHNGLSPGRCQAIIWTNAGIFLIWPFQTNFSEISIDIQTFSFKKIHFKMSSWKWRPLCLGINVLNDMYSTSKPAGLVLNGVLMWS